MRRVRPAPEGPGGWHGTLTGLGSAVVLPWGRYFGSVKSWDMPFNALSLGPCLPGSPDEVVPSTWPSHCGAHAGGRCPTVQS